MAHHLSLGARAAKENTLLRVGTLKRLRVFCSTAQILVLLIYFLATPASLVDLVEMALAEPDPMRSNMSDSEGDEFLDDAEDHLSDNPTMCCFYCGWSSEHLPRCDIGSTNLITPLGLGVRTCEACHSLWKPVTLYQYRVLEDERDVYDAG
jgi:hypothetical protein